MDDRLEAMNKNLEIVRSKLSNLVIIAPITGQLTLLEANIGESKSAGQRVGQVDEVGTYKVNAFIDEFYLSRVTIGQIADRGDRWRRLRARVSARSIRT